MVVFTCNHCGESLQKPRVEKHYLIQCRRPKSVTCVDCFKDFKNEEYVVHTKCITEEERYSAKGSIPGGIVKKGDVKQESWTDMIRSIVQSEKNLKPSLKNLFDTISTYTNVPRKKAKFINFLKSSTGGRVNFTDIEAAWDLIEKYKEGQAQNGNTVEENGTKHKLEYNEDISDMKNGVKIEVEEYNGQAPKKKKKKVKDEGHEEVPVKKNKKVNDEQPQTEDVIESNSNNSQNGNKVEENGTKHKLEYNEDISDMKNGVKVAEEYNGQAVKKKKKKVKDKGSAEVPVKKNKKVNDEQPQTEDVVESNNSQNGNEVEENGTKHKLEYNKDISNMNNGVKVEAEEYSAQAPKKKKKKGKDEGSEEVPVKKTKKVNDEQPQTEDVVESNNSQNGNEVKENGTKHKLEDNEDNPGMENGVKGAEECNGQAPKKKKKKVKDVGNEEVPVKEKKKVNDKQPQTDDIAKSNAFSFKEMILNILNSKGAISCKKLQKKVLNSYLKETGTTEYTEKTIKKYNQKLKKLPNVLVKDDVVSLVAE